MNNRILFFYLKTGGGHLAPVRAIADHLRATYTDRVEPVLHDGMERAGGLARFIIEDGYRITQARAKWIYEAAYAVTKFPPATAANSALVAAELRRGIEEAILRHQPRVIVIAHFFVIAPVLDILRSRQLTIPTVTIVTDPYTAHPLWFHRKNQTMVVFSEQLKEHAVRRGIPADRVHVFPFILDPRFSHQTPSHNVEETKAVLGFRPDQRVVLLLGGGDGLPRGLRITKRIMAELPDTGVVLVCGRNKALFRRAGRLTAKGENLRVFAYADNVPDLIRVSDAVVTKGGASTVMEIIALGKTPVITTYIWEQEKGNVEFILKNKRGVFVKNIGKLPGILAGIFENTPPFQHMREVNRNSPIESGTPAVADFVMRQAGLRQPSGLEG